MKETLYESVSGHLRCQRSYFATGVTRTYDWRIEQLDRMAALLAENEAALQKAIATDFKTASQEFTFETVASIGETPRWAR